MDMENSFIINIILIISSILCSALILYCQNVLKLNDKISTYIQFIFIILSFLICYYINKDIILCIIMLSISLFYHSLFIFISQMLYIIYLQFNIEIKFKIK